MRALAIRRPAPTCAGPHLHVAPPLLTPFGAPPRPYPHFSPGRARSRGAALGTGAVTPPRPPRGLSPCVAGPALFPRGAADPAGASPAAAAPRPPTPPARRAGLTRGAAPPRPAPPRRGGRGGREGEAAPLQRLRLPGGWSRPVTAAPSSSFARCRGAGRRPAEPYVTFSISSAANWERKRSGRVPARGHRTHLLSPH